MAEAEPSEYAGHDTSCPYEKQRRQSGDSRSQATHCAARGQWARVAAMTPEYPSISKCFLDAVDTYANPSAQMFRTQPYPQTGSQAAVWESISAKEMLRRVAGVSRALAE